MGRHFRKDDRAAAMALASDHRQEGRHRRFQVQCRNVLIIEVGTRRHLKTISLAKKGEKRSPFASLRPFVDGRFEMRVRSQPRSPDPHVAERCHELASCRERCPVREIRLDRVDAVMEEETMRHASILLIFLEFP
jgi:NAD-dependent dihydropyrimidine dehydrogenase PreA subunit